MAHGEDEDEGCDLKHGWTYDVFVSFYGEDTRYSFTGNLCYALNQRGIHTFRDDTKLRRGEGISPGLLRAIEESRMAILVFSENYASSSWCLDELVKIIECMKEKGQLVRPVFYYVDPSDVRHQRGSYGSSMAEQEQKLRQSSETEQEWRVAAKRLQTWKVALREAANLSGWHFKAGYEFEFIQRITEEISSKLNYALLHIADYPVGLKYRIFKVMSVLNLKSTKDVSMVGIHGIGGIGKTTIARAVYNSIANQFEAACFLADVRENSMKHGLVQLQETLLLTLLGENIKKLAGNVSEGIPILEHRLRRKKVLLILDDVDSLKQLRSLAGREDWFGCGSRIIITTRNKHLLTLHGIKKLCEVRELNDDEALELFCWNAFKKSKPDENYVKIAELMVQYAKGLPLALSVIGSDLYGKTKEEWESALKKYERIPSKEIVDVLKVSYENLDDNEKEIFLDIACFFKGGLVEDVEKTLDASRFYAKYGIGVLKDKSLITIDEINTVKMHDLIQDLGKNIARMDSPHDPGKRRRLWHHEDVLEVLTKNTGSDTIEGIMLDMPNLEQEVKLSGDAFESMKRLRILIVRNAQISEAPKHLPNNLRVLEWKEYPSPTLPHDFHPPALVALNMPHSHLAMDHPFKKFEKLTYLNFNNCNSITIIPDVSAIPNLTRLLANDCPNLTEIDESVGNLDKLVVLSAENCTRLESIPPGMKSKYLESLNLGKCANIESFPNMLAEMGNMKGIDIEGTAIKHFPHSIAKIGGLEELVLSSGIEDLPINTDMFQNTEELNVENCPQLPKLLGKALMLDRTDWRPKLNRLVLKNCDISDRDLELILNSFLQLKWLVLSNNNFVTIPECIEDLENLLFLHVDNCKQLTHISVVPPYLQYIDARNCISLTPDSSDVLLSQAFQEVENIDIVVLRKKTPNWFDHCGKGGYVDFWVRRKFPGFAVFMLLGGKAELADTSLTCEYRLLINGLQVFQDERTMPVDHVWLFDLRIHFSAQEWYSLKEHLHRGWNHVEISCCVKNNQPQIGTLKCCGIHLYKDRMNINDVSFIRPDLHGSDMSHNKMNNMDDTNIYNEESNDVIFRQVLAKYLGKNIRNLMESLGSGRTRDEEEEEEEEEQRLTDNEIPESCEAVVKDKGKGIAYSEEEHQSWDLMTMESVRGESSEKGAKSSKIPLGRSTEAEPLVTSIHYKEPVFQRIGNLRENGNLTQEPASSASTREIEDDQISMDAFYASLSYPQDTQTNTESINTKPSEETQKTLGILQDLLAKRFSLLLEPKRSKLMEDILEYLVSLAPEDGISSKVKSAILEISRGFTQWGLDYNDASSKLESASAEISRVDELKEGLEANVREFREAEDLENVIWSRLDYLEERKKQLEEEIKAVKAEIVDFSSARDDVAKRKRQVFENGRMLKAERDDLRNRVPRLRAEQECAKITQAYIEDEWSKLGQQFLQSSTFEN